MAQEATTPQPAKNDGQPNVRELEMLKKQCEENMNGWKRALADYENLRREVAARTAEMREYHVMQVTADILPVVDTLREALTHIPPEQHATPWYQGLVQIGKQWEQFAKKYGVEQIESAGEQFDPQLHEAISTSRNESKPHEEIVTVHQHGYTLNGKMIRPAKVTVNKLDSKK